MSEYLFSRIRLGDFITFKYISDKPQAFGQNPSRDVMVLTPNHLGYLHGIKIAGLTPTQQEMLQRFLKVAYTGVNNIYEPMQAQIDQRKKELDVLNQQRNKMIQEGQRVIVTPAPQGSMLGGMIDKGKQALGSVIGKVTTFGRTQATTAPASQMNPQIQVQIQKNDQLILQ
jgi:hypothetical protein